tara:strand:- start:888 stop:1154 length:267 start_codon:yes stop_codon:yes gene_type:complete
MISYLVIGICVFLLIAVIYISAKPISMGIEARRNINEKNNSDKLENEDEDLDENNINISSEIIRLNKLKNEGLLTEKEYEQAKRKLLD